MRINRRNVRRLRETIRDKRQELEEGQLKAIKRIVTKKRVAGLCREQGYVYRERLITPLVTILHMIGSATRVGRRAFRLIFDSSKQNLLNHQWVTAEAVDFGTTASRASLDGWGGSDAPRSVTGAGGRIPAAANA